MPNRDRILAIRSGALGDTIVTLPSLAALARIAARVEFVGTSPYIDLALSPRLAADVCSIDRAMFGALFDARVDDAELVRWLESFDHVVAWSRLPRLGELAERLGLGLIEMSPHPPDGVHASEHLYGALGALGIHGPAPHPVVDVDGSTPPLELRRRYVAIHPSSGSAAKNWAAEHFGAVARLARLDGLDVVWVEGEADESVVSGLVRQTRGTVARRLPLRELGAVLAGAEVFVGNDSGVSHLAAAVGASTVAIFVATEPVQWAPRGPRVMTVAAGASPEAVWGFACDLMKGR